MPLTRHKRQSHSTIRADSHMNIFRPNTLQGRKILIIYDDPQIVTIIRLYLQKACKDTVLEAVDSDEAIAKAQATTPDLIIIEMALADSDGYESGRRLKAVPLLHHIPILFIGDAKNYSGAYDLGAQGFLLKPFEPDELRKARIELLNGKTYWPSPPYDPWLLFDQSK